MWDGYGNKRSFGFPKILGSKSRQSARREILLNLGIYFNVQQEHWQPLCERIKVLWSRQTEMGFAASLPIHVEAAAQWIVTKLSKKTEEKVKEREEARKKRNRSVRYMSLALGVSAAQLGRRFPPTE